MEEILSRQGALEKGLVRHFTGKPCVKGHIDYKYTKSGGCIICARSAVDKYAKANPDKVKACKKNWDKRNKDHVLAYSRAYAPKQAEWVKNNYDKAKKASAEWTKRNPEKGAAKSTRYRLSKQNRTPAWADLDKIEEIYRLSAELTKQTKIPHEVDHIIPIQGELVSGLHVPENLQVLTKSANAAKSNKFNIEEYNAQVIK